VPIEILAYPRLPTRSFCLPHNHQCRSSIADTYIIVIASSRSIPNSSIGIAAPLFPKMPRSQAIPQHLRPEIERRILQERQTHRDVLHLLAGEGYICQKRSLIRRCNEWGISRRGAGDDPVVLEYIDNQFHITLDNDEKIAGQLATLGHSVIASRVKDLRLANGWRHRQPLEQQQKEQ
jgi:hypothetical protein